MAARPRDARYPERRRIGAKLIPSSNADAAAVGMLRLGLIRDDDDRHAVGWAIRRLLDAATPLAAVGAAIYRGDYEE